MNAPDPFELFVLPDNVKKVSFKKDGKIQNAATFTIEREDHTLGNLIRMQLHRDPNVLFAGYKMPHPLEHKFVLKIQTTPHSTPTQAFDSALTDLERELGILEERTKNQLAEFARNQPQG